MKEILSLCIVLHSIIHVDPTQLDETYLELAKCKLACISFFGSFDKIDRGQNASCVVKMMGFLTH